MSPAGRNAAYASKGSPGGVYPNSGGSLEGRIVVLARSAGPGDELRGRLESLGAKVLVWPTLSFGPPARPESFLEAVDRIDAFDWVAFTSPRAVAAVVERRDWSPSGTDPEFGVAAVGSATANSLRVAGWPAHMVGKGPGAAALVDAFRSRGIRGRRILFPAGSLALPTLEDGLRALGNTVTRVEAYTTEVVPPAAEQVERDMAEGVDAVVFASPSAVRAVELAFRVPLGQVLDGVGAVAIGETTAGALRSAGIPDPFVASAASVSGLVHGVLDALSEPGSEPHP